MIGNTYGGDRNRLLIHKFPEIALIHPGYIYMFLLLMLSNIDEMRKKISGIQSGIQYKEDEND